MDNIFNKLMSSKKIIIISMLVLGILLIALSGAVSKKEIPEQSVFDESEYVVKLEQRLSEIISSIRGAGECNVMINLTGTTESVYVKENKKSYDSSEDVSKSQTEDSIITMTDSNGNQYALITKQIMPEIGGVTVVCDGGGDSNVQSAVIDAVSTVLGIGSNKVCVIAKAK